MSTTQELYQQLSQLMPLEKLQLAEMLLADLDTPDPQIDAVWRDEAQKRWQAYKDGKMSSVSYDSIMQKYK
ncbi:addiction module protein [Methylomonas sp. SURF-1]|uniref:Addiction module protein n=1 Tax=Methylomonas aurea TaxID=2952224 RepID=A0ABT1UEQ6_9GAMM|nr:addiction module protein [Methylomonas sp. SURF-1]MCQ8180712.1 addiction module protein [Methylomonas sp. SURF-1]